MLKTALMAAAAAIALLPVALPAQAQEAPTEFRVGLLGGENEADRLRNHACLAEKLEAELGMPVKLFPSPDYAGVLQGLLGDTLEYATLGAAGYAGIWLEDPEAVEPILTTEQIDGSTGYFSVLLVRADSGIQDLQGLKGKTLGFADPNSTSGYLIPKVTLPQDLGMPIEEFFAETGFAGGHEQAVIAVLNKQYDAAVTWTSGVGEYDQGYSSGNLRSMVDKGMLDMNDITILWTSPAIPNGPAVVRKDLPQDMKDKVKALLMRMPTEDPECFMAIGAGENKGFVEVSHDEYQPIIDARRAEIEQD